MRHLCTAFLAGAAIAGSAAFASQAVAAPSAFHKMTIALPGGGSEIIEYTGTTAPKVTLSRAPFQAPFFGVPFYSAWTYSPWMSPIGFGADPAFAALDHWAANLNRQMTAFWNHAGTGADALTQAALRNPGPGSSRYSFVSQSSGNNFCARMTSITAPANGGKPKIVTRTSGNCGALHAQGMLSADPAATTRTWHHDDMAANAPSVMPVALHTLTSARPHAAL